MITIVNWRFSIAVLIGIGLLLVIVKRLFRRTWPKQLRVSDLLMPVYFWVVSAVTFQVWHVSLVAPLGLMLSLWGVGLLLWQVYVRDNFSFRRFILIWWRLVTLVAIIAMLGMYVYAWLTV
jgi:hypothetical protein